MSVAGFKYVPHVITQPGDRDELVEEFWDSFLEYNEGFASLRAVYTGRTPAPGRHDRCTQPPLMFARVEHRDPDGKLTHTTTHPDLLSTACWTAHRNGRLVFTRPGYFPNEIGDSA